MEYKSHLCVRMLEKAIGAEQLLQVLNKQLSLAVNAAQPGSNPKLWPNMVINTLSFKVCSRITRVAPSDFKTVSSNINISQALHLHGDGEGHGRLHRQVDPVGRPRAVPHGLLLQPQAEHGRDEHHAGPKSMHNIKLSSVINHHWTFET